MRKMQGSRRRQVDACRLLMDYTAWVAAETTRFLESDSVEAELWTSEVWRHIRWKRHRRTRRRKHACPCLQPSCKEQS